MIVRIWQNPRFRRELLIRGFITTAFSAITYLFLGADAWVWIFPPAVVALVLAKWLFRPGDEEEQPGADHYDRP